MEISNGPNTKYKVYYSVPTNRIPNNLNNSLQLCTIHTYLQFIPFDLLTQQIRYNRFIFVRLYFFHLISRSLDVSIHEGKVDKFFHWHPHACSLLFAYQPWVSRKPEEHGRDGCQEVSRIWEYYRFAPCMELELSPLDEVALFLCHH